MASHMHVEPARDQDMPRCMEIYYLAFGFVPIHELSRGANTPENHLKSARLELQSQREHMAKFPSSPVCVKCVQTDPATGLEKIVGYAEWYIYDRERTDEECMREPYAMRFSWMENDEERDQCRAFVARGTQKRRAYMGTRPFGQLKFMCVDPGHRRQGIGSLITRWGMDRCAELGIPAYLETSPEGMYMYEKLGFEIMGSAEDRKAFLYPGMIWLPPTFRKSQDASVAS